jgi:hypothetical protein
MAPSEALEYEDIEMVASRHPRPDEMEAYERVLGDAILSAESGRTLSRSY